MPVPFRRSPQLEPSFEPQRITLPAPAAEPARERFPAIAMAAPLVVGLAMLAVTRSPLTIAFVALSPLLALGSWLDHVLRGHRARRAAAGEFTTALAAAEERIAAALAEERAARAAADPPTPSIAGRMLRRAPELWARRPGDAGFLRIRLGLGTAPSRTTTIPPPRHGGSAESWRRVEAIALGAAGIDGVPIAERLDAGVAIGVAGAGDAAAVVRAIVVQLAGLHAPGELRLAALVADGAAAEWAWLARLPHLDGRLGAPPLAAEPAGRERLLSVLEQAAATSVTPLADDAGLVVLALGELPERARLIALTERRALAVIWLAASAVELPAHCRTFLDADPPAAVIRTEQGERIPLAEVERCSRAEAIAAAEAIADLVDADAPPVAADLSATVGFARIEPGVVEGGPAAVIARWRASRTASSLDARIGVDRDGVRVVDLRADGPHALLGGMTGAGKSELLQTWICSLAASHDPRRLTFLLIDYKGGAAFTAVTALPHVVGLVTDLTPRLARRALVSLRAELVHRERRLAAAGVKDLLELPADDPTTPPALVIVVDEFAALAGELPEFVDGLVDVAQRGRSLGLHLVMATQRPAGVIREQLRANTSMRIALRLAEPSDSVDVLGTPEAAALTSGTPGRGFIRIGPGRPAPFQTARLETAEAAALVAAVRAAAALDGCPTPRRPWLPELPRTVPLDSLDSLGPAPGLPIALADHPGRQEQQVLAFAPDVDGHLLVVGRGASGRSTALRTLAIAAARATVDGERWQVYAVDAAGDLAPLDALPIVGDVVALRDEERVRRAFDVVVEEMEQRGRLRAGATMADDIAAPPRILLLVDGLGALRAGREHRLDDTVLPALSRILRHGRAVRVHVAVAAEGAAAVPSAMLGEFGLRVVLRLGTAAEAAMLGAPADTEDWPAGRGVARGAEIQLATAGADERAETARMRRLARRLRRAGVPPVPAVPALEERIPLARLPPTIGGRPALGVTATTLSAIGFPGRGVIVVAGGHRSGRSTAVRTMLASIGRARPSSASIRVSPEHPAMPASIERGTVLVVEHAHDFAGTPEEARLVSLLREVRRGGGLAIVELDPAFLAAGWQLQTELRAAGAGIFLRAEEQDAIALFRVPLARSRSPVPGRGWLVEGGEAVELQLAIDAPEELPAVRDEPP